MSPNFVKKILPHLIAIGVFLLVAVVFSKPALEGKVLTQSDVTNWEGMAHGSLEYHKEKGHVPLWNANGFAGMPNYQITYNGGLNLTAHVHQLLSLYLPKPINFFFLACMGFYFLCLVMRINPYIGIIGALAYAYASFNAIIIGVGHDTQMLCLAYSPALLASLLLLYDKKYVLGTALTALFTAIMINMNHYQVVYYFMIIAVIVTIFHAIQWIKQKDWKHVALSASLALVAAGFGVLSNIGSLWPTYEYSKATIRGGNPGLSAEDTKSKGEEKGLSRQYAFDWSYGIAETATLIVPNVYGGASNRTLDINSNFGKKLLEKGVSEEQADQLARGTGRTYWGAQPFTEGPVYLGAVICFLFLFGMIYLKSKHKWWILTVALFAIVLAWGKNFAAFNYFLFDYLPLYNKFRAPSMALVMPQLVMPLLAALCLNQLVFGNNNKAELLKKFKITAIATGVLFLLLAFMYMSFDYRSENTKRTTLVNNNTLNDSLNQANPPKTDNSVYEYFIQATKNDTEFSRSMLSALRSDRKALFGKDLVHSFIFVALALGLIFAFARGILKNKYALIAGMGLLVVIDLLSISSRYLNYDNYLEPEESENAFFQYKAADDIILRDKDPNYRVLNFSVGLTGDAITSYNHKSLGGYHAAKLSVYQELIENQLQKQPMNMGAVNMLNAKYFIQLDPQSQQAVAIPNPNALGNAWFVKQISFVENANAEMKALTGLNTKDSAVMDKSFQPIVKAMPQWDSAATIKMTAYDPDAISYKSSAKTPQFAVFSEIYYKAGWNAYLDGNKTDYAKVNYALRGMPVPAGDHTIEFRFEPESVKTGRLITTIFSSLTVLLLLIGIFLEWRKTKKAAALPAGGVGSAIKDSLQ
jgi:Bacterial membrane protein YfhO